MLTVAPEIAHRSLPDRPLRAPNLRGVGRELGRVLPIESFAARSDGTLMTMTTALDIPGMTLVGMRGTMTGRTSATGIRADTGDTMTTTEKTATMAVSDTVMTTTVVTSDKGRIAALRIETCGNPRSTMTWMPRIPPEIGRLLLNSQ